MIDCIIIAGPTGTGKSDFGEALAEKIGGEIINADSAQMYRPLTIGTAKPAWQDARVRHHLFDCAETPDAITAGLWSAHARDVIQDCRTRGVIPVVIGGSGFYIASLFFTLNPAGALLSRASRTETTTQLYKELLQKDAVRAEKLHPHDRYRIIRALSMIDEGAVPSQCEPHFMPLGNSLIISIDRDDADLKERITRRVNLMLREGWRAEIEGLSPEWRDFVVRKKILGYGVLMHEPDDARAQEKVVQETWQYVRRQRAFLRNLRKRFDREHDRGVKGVPIWRQCSLTSVDPAVYLGEVSSWIYTL